MFTSKDYSFYSDSLPLYVPNTYSYEVRNAAFYPFPPRHPDTVAILCIWFAIQTDGGPRTYGLTFSLNAHGYRIVDSFQTERQRQIDAWLAHVRQEALG